MFMWIGRMEKLQETLTEVAKVLYRTHPVGMMMFTYDEAKKLYKEREKAYKKLADVVVDVEKLSLDEQLTYIAKKCNL